MMTSISIPARCTGAAIALALASFVGSATTKGAPVIAFAILGSIMAGFAVMFVWKPDHFFVLDDETPTDTATARATHTVDRSMGPPSKGRNMDASLLPITRFEKVFVLFLLILGGLFAAGFSQGPPAGALLVGGLCTYHIWNSLRHLRRAYSFQHRTLLLMGEVFGASCILGLILQPFF